jgi:hypothetical protein
MRYLASVALVLLFGVAWVAPGSATATDPLTTSCQCFALVCTNGSTAVPCQATCPGTAVCTCASCIPVGSGKGTYASGPNSCYCQ